MQSIQIPGCTRAAAAAVALLHFAVGAAPLQAAEDIHIESSRNGGLVEIRATADVAADRATAWRVLTDYGRYPEFIPDLRESRVVSRNGTTVIVEQVGSAALGPLRIPVEITFQIAESPPFALESRAIAGSVRTLESRYSLTAHGDGTRLTYSGSIRPALPLFGSLGQSTIEANIARQFRALVTEIERHPGVGADAASEAPGR